MNKTINSIFLLIGLGLISLACGGGSDSGAAATNAETATIRVKGLSSGDKLVAYNLAGTSLGQATATASGDGAVGVPNTYFSVRIALLVDNVPLFESLVTKEELYGGNVLVTLNAASTVMTRSLDEQTLSAIYDAELAAYEAAMAAAAEQSGGGTSSASQAVIDLLLSIPSEQSGFTATVTQASSANLGYSVGDTVLVGLSGSGTLFLDGQSIAVGYQNSDPSYANTIFWDGPSPVVYQTYISSGTLYYFSASNANDINDYVSFSLPFAAKPRSVAPVDSSTLAGLLTSMFGSASISGFSLLDAEGLSSALYAEIQVYTYLSAMALRVADEGTLSSSGWQMIESAYQNALADSGVSGTSSDKAKVLADLVQSYLTPSTPITVSDFGTQMLIFLGDSETVINKLSALQSGDTAGVLSLVVGATGELSAPGAVTLAKTALEEENVLEAYEAAVVAVSLDPANEEARLLAALTRMLSVGFKNTNEVKAFQQAASLDYTFVGNDALESLIDSDEPEAGTVYASAETTEGLPTVSEINDFVKDAYLADINASIADLEAINLLTFSGFTLTVAMQGKDVDGEDYGSSDIEFDTLDVKGLLSFMYLLKANAEYYLGQNLEFSQADTPSEMLTLVEDAVEDGGVDFLNPSNNEITDARVRNWINSNSSFLTITQSYLSASRSSLITSAEGFNDLIDELQALDSVGDPRFNQLIETPDFEFNNMTVMNDSEIDGFQAFVGDVLNSLSGSTTVDPTVLSSYMESSSLNLSGLFSAQPRTYVTNSSGTAVVSGGELQLDEEGFETHLYGTISSGNLFGMTARTYGGNASELFLDAYDYLEEWLEDGSTSFSRSSYISSSYVAPVETPTETPSTVQQAPTALSGSATFSWFENEINGIETETGTMTITAGSNPGEMVVAEGGTTLGVGHLNGLALFLPVKDSSYEDAYVFIFTDTTFSEAVYLNTYKDVSTGDVGADIGHLTKTSGTLTLSGDLGPTTLSSSGSFSDTWYAVGGSLVNPDDTGNGSVTISSGSGPYGFFSDADNNAARMYFYGRMYCYASADEVGNISLGFGAFVDDNYERYTGISAGLDASDNSGWMDAVRGVVSSTGYSFSHDPGYDYDGSSLTFTNNSKDIVGGGTNADNFSMNTSSTDDETLSLTVGSTGYSTKVFQAGPVVMVPFRSSDSDFSFSLFIFEDNSLTEFTGMAAGVDGTGIWADFHSGTNGAGTKIYIQGVD